jgi:hypothetical protein
VNGIGANTLAYHDAAVIIFFKFCFRSITDCSVQCSRSGTSFSAFYFDASSGTCQLGSKVSLKEATSNPANSTVMEVGISVDDPWHMIATGFDGGYLNRVKMLKDFFLWHKMLERFKSKGRAYPIQLLHSEVGSWRFSGQLISEKG